MCTKSFIKQAVSNVAIGAKYASLTGYSRIAMLRNSRDFLKEKSKASSTPLIGNGDIYNYQDGSKVSSIMIVREIKEKREWDISASDFIHDFANYGLDHSSSDRIGVDNTRK
ncbi:hypothetical protein ACTFIW_002810 [Dictyostelium discoideum]